MERETKRYAYKLSGDSLKIHISSFISPLTKLLATFAQIVLVFWKLPLAMASSVSPGKVKVKGKAPITVDTTIDTNVHNSTNLTNLLPVPTLKPPSGGSSSKTRNRKGGCAAPRFDPTAMFNKLAAARENDKKKKELTLVGFLVGEQKEFPRVFAKLRMEWKPLKGTLSFNPLKSGWFEISFSNQTDFQMIWNNRPYHLFSQLLLIKQWYSGFDPTNESISLLDLWVRLHYLPEEFANKDALETIIEGNFVGKFIRMDPSHNSERWNLFTRFYINTDVERTLGKGVIVLDKHFNQMKYSLWFDDFPPGCGACRKIAHTFRDCPSKNSPIPTLQLTIKKPSSKKPQLDSSFSHSLVSEGWNLIGKNNKSINPSKLIIPNNNIYLTERGGICVTYESDDSEEGVQHLLDSEEITMGGPNLISVAADLHPYNLIMEGKNDIATEKNQGNLTIMDQNKDKDNNCQNLPITYGSTTLSGTILIKSASKHCNEALDKVENNQQTGNSKTEENILKNKLGCEAPPPHALQSGSKEQMTFPTLSPAEVCNVNQQQHPLEEEMQEYDDEQYDYEYEDLLLDEPTDQNTLSTTKTLIRDGNPIMISDDPPFSEKDLDEFINNDDINGDMGQATSKGTFHSLHNSIHSSSFINGMERLIVQQPDHSNSTSSKRKVIEGTEDTATSEAREGKKPRI